VRLSKWYTVKDSKERARLTREVSALVLNRAPKMCNFLEYKDKKLVYKRYASLFFVMCIGKDDNELITLEMIHQYVEVSC
jgi:AP-1 complex subunit sigma 1/2